MGLSLKLNEKYDENKLAAFLKESYSVYCYGNNLWTTYSNWPQGLPSPATPTSILSYEDNLKFHKLLNDYFMVQLLAIILHELEHKNFGHNHYDPETEEESRAEEFDADNVAVEKFLKCIDFKDERSFYKMPFLLTYSAFLQRESLPQDSSHPAEHKRLNNILIQLMKNHNPKRHSTQESFYTDIDNLPYVITISVLTIWLQMHHNKDVTSKEVSIHSFTASEWYTSVYNEADAFIQGKLQWR